MTDHECPIPDIPAGLIDPRWCFSSAQQSLRGLPTSVAEADLLRSELLLYTCGSLEIYYAPFDHVNIHAKVTLVGITPGRHQMWLGCLAARSAIQNGEPDSSVLSKAKANASFGGPMRKNLVRMLDGIGLAGALGIDTCAGLFGPRADLVDTTSAILYPVFVRGQNYGGAVPPITSEPILRDFVEHVLARELLMTSRSLVIPLGRAAGLAIERLVTLNHLDSGRCLFGFPHPSGANGHREQTFARQRAALERTVEQWAGMARH